MINQNISGISATLKQSLICCLLLLSACGSTPEKEEPQVDPNNYVSSTEYFADRTSSVSMRASFRKADSQMAEGYRFQFRTISKRAVFLESISIIAGGKRFFLEQNQVVLPADNGLNFSLPLTDSQFIARYPNALLQFKHNNSSHIFTIELHQLKIFSP